MSLNKIEKICQKTVKKLKNIEDQELKKEVLFGFDGFVDNVWSLVEERNSIKDYKLMKSMLTLNERIKESAGGGLSTEILRKDKRPGGFNANTARVLTAFDLKPILMALFEGEEIFSEIKSKAEVINLGEACSSQIFEFNDGKLMFPNNENIRNMDWASIKERIELERLIELFERSELIAFGYWANMPYYNKIIEGIKNEVLPEISSKKRKLFMDFGNVKKRSDEDLKLFAKSLSELENDFEITVSLNRTEALDTAGALSIEYDNGQESYELIASKIRSKMCVSNFVLHTNNIAISAGVDGVKKLKQPYCKNPVLTTGAGDTFNGGYILGLLLSVDREIQLAAASAAAGYFIRNGKPPRKNEMIDFLKKYPELFVNKN